jgi:hypothetical protein
MVLVVGLPVPWQTARHGPSPGLASSRARAVEMALAGCGQELPRAPRVRQGAILRHSEGTPGVALRDACDIAGSEHKSSW